VTKTRSSQAYSDPCEIRYLGVQGYEIVWQQMQDFTFSRTANTPDELWVLQHEPVFTLGQAGKKEHILDAHGIPVINCDRGGQVTYHGPGQLVIYLLIDVRRRRTGVRELVDLIEKSIAALLNDYGITSQTQPRAPGVYVDGKKIAALGLRIKQGCSYHGLSLNIDLDLQPFSYINPCGYKGLQVTQLADCLPDVPQNLYEQASDKLLHHLLTLL
jgi:lipoyl(octanoyl) transferase